MGLETAHNEGRHRVVDDVPVLLATSLVNEAAGPDKLCGHIRDIITATDSKGRRYCDRRRKLLTIVLRAPQLTI